MVDIDAVHRQLRAHGREVQREETETASEFDDAAFTRKELTHLFEEPSANDAEPHEAVRAHDERVVRLDDARHDVMGARFRERVRREGGLLVPLHHKRTTVSHDAPPTPDAPEVQGPTGGPTGAFVP